MLSASETGAGRRAAARRRSGKTAALLGRAGLAGFVGELFSYPETRPDFAAAHRAAVQLGRKWSAAVSQLEAQWQRVDRNTLQSEWLRLFSLTPLCSPYETAQSEDALGKATVLADVAGFYRAFGLQPDQEMADHIASEMGFAAHLLTKLAYAQSRGMTEQAEVTGDAYLGFFGEHLGPFAGRFFTRAQAAAGPFYRGAAGLGLLLIRELARATNRGRSRPHNGSG
ncbi:MAG: molecular chaperone TorD family protein [Deltaproteobacteria bacterium]|nr:molecular chaperone TorD family protein [Deltaproteobacteria bacterium]